MHRVFLLSSGAVKRSTRHSAKAFQGRTKSALNGVSLAQTCAGTLVGRGPVMAKTMSDPLNSPRMPRVGANTLDKWRSWGRDVSAWYKDWSPWLAAIFGLMVFGLLAARFSDGARAFLNDPVTSQWASAIATAAAAIIALVIASREERRNHRREVLAGELAAGSLRNFVGSLRVVASQLAAKMSEGSVRVDPTDSRSVLAADVMDQVAFLRQSLEKIPATTIQPYNARITANVVFMIDQLHIAETAATLFRDEEGVRIALRSVEEGCLVVESLIHPAHENAIRRHLSE